MSLLKAERVWAAPPGGEPVVRDFSIEISAGEWVALSGPNGGGKTTLALALAGLRPLARGRIELESGTAGSPLDRRQIAVILQDPSAQLFTGTVRDELGWTALNLGFGADQVADEVKRWAQRLGLERDLSADPRTLSAGRQQLVLLGSAMVSAPRLLIADEPGAHLDDDARARVLAAIRAELARGLSVLWLTQSQRELEAADRRLWIGAEAPDRAPLDPCAGGGTPAAVDARSVVSEERSPQSPGVARVRIEPRAPASGPAIRLEHAAEFELPARGVVALLGPNAAGKSVLLAALAGLESQPQVEVDWSGPMPAPALLVSQYPERQLFQERVADELSFAAVSRGLERGATLERAARALERLDLAPGMLDRRCWDLSSGERRLIEVVAGLIAPARLLALDEPTAGLDPRRRAALAGLVRERAREGPVVLASQDLEWAEGLSTRIVWLGQGAEKGLPSLSKKTD
jgi:energy-coupling factor transport system ATP-binding protein